MLERLGFAANVADNGRIALEALSQHPYALVLMDCQMPEMDGFEASAEIRRREGAARHTPIVAMTANAMTGARAECIAAGMDDYISKPIRMDALAAALERWMPADSGTTESPTPIHGRQAGAADEGVPTEAIDPAALERLRELDVPGQPGMVDALIELFLQDTPVRIRAMVDGLANDDPRATRRAAHTLKGEAEGIGAHEVQALSLELEQLAKAETLAGADEFVVRIERAFEQARACLEAIRLRGAA
jgi:two-component system, sensor histidine kinase and response regulator